MTDEGWLDLSTAIPRRVLDSLGEGITLANAEGRILFSNRAADHILGAPATDAPPEEWAEHYGVFLPEDRASPFPTDRYPLVRALSGEATTNVEMWIRNRNVPDGVLITVTGQPLRDEHGQIRGAGVVFRDITALRRAHEDLERNNRILREVQRQKDELAAFVVHDLKSPITAIMLSAEMLIQDLDIPGADLGDLDDIHDAAQTLHRMVLDLLDIRQAEDGRLHPQVTSLRVDSLLAEVVQDLAATAAASETTVHLADGIPAYSVSADPDLIRRIVQNLVGNCLKYAPGGRVLLNAERARPSVLLITVEDDGAGVAPELRERIFQIWTTAEREERGRHRDSRGIGLSFARLAVEAHGGRIWVDDSDLGGARFCVELPEA